MSDELKISRELIMPKNVVVCCDGTANEFAQDRTNVIKLFSTLVQDPVRQVVFYHPGLGTMEPAHELSPLRRKIARFLGLATGYGLAEDIRDTYVFLMRQFAQDDRLFLFGFSRGAYTVRAVASLLHMYGLIPKGNEPLVPYAIRMMLAIHRLSEQQSSGSQVHDYFQLADDFKKTFSAYSCKPWFIGVWETVSSVGWYENPLRLPYTGNNPDIEIGRHAVALDERRAFFRTNLWVQPQNPATRHGPKDLKQIWFAGVHADVGGGYPEAESGLSKIALKWMLDEAIAKKLLVDSARCNLVLGGRNRYVPPDPNGSLHKSLKSWWWLAELIWKRHYDWQTHQWKRRPNLGRWRTIPPGSVIHESVFRRGGEYLDHLRKRLPADFVRDK